MRSRWTTRLTRRWRSVTVPVMSWHHHRLRYQQQTKECDMRRSGTGSGGGYGMNKNVEPRVRTGSGSKSTRPAGVAQIGTSIGDHVTERARGSGYRGEQLHNPDRNFQP